MAPGSSEVISVDFHPREHRYHYDCIRLHTDSENLLIPLHAYPVRTKCFAQPHSTWIRLAALRKKDSATMTDRIHLTVIQMAPVQCSGEELFVVTLFLISHSIPLSLSTMYPAKKKQSLEEDLVF